MRTPIRRPAVLAVATCAALSLMLTACGDGGEGVKDEGAAWTPKPAGAGTGGEFGKKGTAATGSEGSAAQADAEKETGAKAVACGAHDVKITAAKQDGVPTTHITLTAKNVSAHSCTLLRYPLIAFGDIRTAEDVPAVAKSEPGTPVVLNAGTPAYAAVRINKGGVEEQNRSVTSFNVSLFAADGPAEGSRTVTAPTGGIAVHDAVATTGYWTPELRFGADEF